MNNKVDLDYRSENHIGLASTSYKNLLHFYADDVWQSYILLSRASDDHSRILCGVQITFDESSKRHLLHCYRPNGEWICSFTSDTIFTN